MVFCVLGVQGWRSILLALLVGIGTSLKLGPADTNTSDAVPETTSLSYDQFTAHHVPDSVRGDSEVVWTGRRWTPGGWVEHRSPGHRAYFDLHIPKTAGCSFSIDVRNVLAHGEGYFSREDCYHTRRPMLPGDGTIALIREPVGHVYSQFLECKYAGWGRSVVPAKDKWMMASITKWLQHFKGDLEHYDLRCYHPYNMQTRALTCTGGNCHHYNGEEIPVKQALKTIDSLFFVGIVGHYQASLCLFFAKTHEDQPLPSFCNCKDKQAWNSFKGTHEVHGVPAHSKSDLSEQDLSMIIDLTRLDKQVYEAAAARFAGEAAEVEARTGTKILCED